MNAIIGTEDDILGFGLTGIEQRICITKKTSKEKINKHLESLNPQTKLCLINESALEKIDPQKTHITLIRIPNHQKAPEIQKIQKIAKETLGINI